MRSVTAFSQFTNRIAHMGFQHSGDLLWSDANRRLQNTRYLCPLWFLLLSFAVGMMTGLRVKTPVDYLVFPAAGAAFLLAFSGCLTGLPWPIF
jgi:hypothetical protein